MLTISQLAAYAGVTVRAVRHYHKIGLLPEAERDRSGYRSYDAAAVVRLIRVHTLADAGSPDSRPATTSRFRSRWWVISTGCAVTASASGTSRWNGTPGS